MESQSGIPNRTAFTFIDGVSYENLQANLLFGGTEGETSLFQEKRRWCEWFFQLKRVPRAQSASRRIVAMQPVVGKFLWRLGRLPLDLS